MTYYKIKLSDLKNKETDIGTLTALVEGKGLSDLRELEAPLMLVKSGLSEPAIKVTQSEGTFPRTYLTYPVIYTDIDHLDGFTPDDALIEMPDDYRHGFIPATPSVPFQVIPDEDAIKIASSIWAGGWGPLTPVHILKDEGTSTPADLSKDSNIQITSNYMPKRVFVAPQSYEEARDQFEFASNGIILRSHEGKTLVTLNSVYKGNTDVLEKRLPEMTPATFRWLEGNNSDNARGVKPPTMPQAVQDEISNLGLSNKPNANRYPNLQKI